MVTKAETLAEALQWPKEINVGRIGTQRPIEFQKLMMDKDYVWKLEVILSGTVDEFEMFYDVSLVLDPAEYNRQLKFLVAEANSKQMSLESITGKIATEMGNIHHKYENETQIFAPVDFRAALLKMEKKAVGKQLLQLCIDTDAAVKISKLVNNLDKAAIVLRPQQTNAKDREEN